MTTTVERDETDELTDEQRRTALALAEKAIEYGVERGGELSVSDELADVFPDEDRATFVTVYVDGELNGCIGRLEPRRPLHEDIIQNAHRAAFEDPRLPPVRPDDLDDLSVHVSVLEPLERVPVEAEDEIWEYVEPGVHGVLLRTENRRGTFLPSVWEKCPDPEAFLGQLKKKAELPPDAWPSEIEVYRYTVDEFSKG